MTCSHMSYFFISKQLLWELFFRISNSNKITTNSPIIRTDVEEYVLTLPSGKLHFFRTISDAPGAAATGSCIYIFYMLNEKTNGVGIAVSYSTPCVYYVKLKEGELKHIALS